MNQKRSHLKLGSHNFGHVQRKFAVQDKSKASERERAYLATKYHSNGKDPESGSSPASNEAKSVSEM
jgi:hypothetical protein